LAVSATTCSFAVGSPQASVNYVPDLSGSSGHSTDSRLESAELLRELNLAKSKVQTLEDTQKSLMLELEEMKKEMSKVKCEELLVEDTIKTSPTPS